MVSRKVENEQGFLRFENQPPIQSCPALVKILAELADGQARMNVRFAKTFNHQLDGGGNFFLPARVPGLFF